MTKSEFVRKYYDEYLELNESELTKAEGNFYLIQTQYVQKQ